MATSGTGSYVVLGDREGIALILVTKNGASMFSKNLETTRLIHDELPNNLEIVECPWFEEVERFVGKAAKFRRSRNGRRSGICEIPFEKQDETQRLRGSRLRGDWRKTMKALERAMKKFTTDITEIEAKALVEAKLARGNSEKVSSRL